MTNLAQIGEKLKHSVETVVRWLSFREIQPEYFSITVKSHGFFSILCIAGAIFCYHNAVCGSSVYMNVFWFRWKIILTAVL